LDSYLESTKEYNSVKKKKRREFRKQKADVLNDNVNNTPVFWKELKQLGGSNKSGISECIKIEDWFEHFKNLLEHETEDRNTSRDLSDNLDDILDTNISREEVRLAIKDLKNGKSGGLDGIIPEMLKEGGEEIVDLFTSIFNCVFNNGVYPEEWSKAIIVPIFKKGDKHNPDNYRGISLINTACKCYTSILNKRLHKWLNFNNKIVENQAGFRKNYSTSDQIFSLYAAVQKCLNKPGQKVYVAFIDFKKAFDKVDHAKLLDTLHKEGIKGKFFCAIQSMYDSLMACVRANGELSDFFDCPTGVRQGCVLSPALFSLFINQVANYVSEHGVHGIQLLPNLLELFILLFADDVALLSTTPGGLQTQLNLLKECCDRLNMYVNEDKSKIMVFRKGGYLGQNEKWFFDGKALEVVNRYCYLGYTFSTMLSFNIGTSTLVTKGKKAVYLLNRAFNNCKEMSSKTYFRIFDAKVQSILLYSSELWGYDAIENIEKVHMLACKRFLGVPLRTPNKMVYRELNRYPLYINSSVRCIKYWVRLLQMDITRLPKQAYMMMLEQDRNSKRNWATSVRELLTKIGFLSVWDCQETFEVSSFLRECRRRLIQSFTQEWSDSVYASERYKLYLDCTLSFGNASYIESINTYCFRVALSQIRTNVLPINNNMNRYGENPSLSNCPFCDNQLENEKHLLFECFVYEDLRDRFLPGIQENMLPALLNIDYNMKSLHVAKFVFYAMKRRSSILAEPLE
jgi:hypothetical protein